MTTTATTCKHRWNCSSPSDGFVTQVCKMCKAEKKVRAWPFEEGEFGRGRGRMKVDAMEEFE